MVFAFQWKREIIEREIKSYIENKISAKGKSSLKYPAKSKPIPKPKPKQLLKK